MQFTEITTLFLESHVLRITRSTINTKTQKMFEVSIAVLQYTNKKLKQFHYRPGVAQRVAES
jgi:hypothetical protein